MVSAATNKATRDIVAAHGWLCWRAGTNGTWKDETTSAVSVVSCQQSLQYERCFHKSWEGVFRAFHYIFVLVRQEQNETSSAKRIGTLALSLGTSYDVVSRSKYNHDV